MLTTSINLYVYIFPVSANMYKLMIRNKNEGKQNIKGILRNIKIIRRLSTEWTITFFYS